MLNLTQTIEREFPGKKVAIVGDLVADQFLSGAITRVSREAPVFILRHEETVTLPGGAANAAANVSALGGEPILIGVMGRDERGELLRKSLEEAGVDCGQVVTDSAITTTAKIRVLAGHSYSVKQQVIRIDHENAIEYSDAVRAKLLENLCIAAQSADAIVFSDYGCGVLTPQLYDAARKVAAERGVPLVVDSRWRLRDLEGAMSATPNQEEVEHLIGSSLTDQRCIELCRELEFTSLLITCGNKGMILVEPDCEILRIPPVGSTEPVDVTGAGDTVIAAYSLGLAAGLRFRDAAIIANHSGGIVVMKKRTATATREELIASLRAEQQLSRSDAAL